MKLKLSVLGVIMLMAFGLSSPAMAGSFYYLSDSGDIADWYTNCSGADQGVGPPLTQTYVVHVKGSYDTVELSDCTQSCSTGDLHCGSVLIVED